MKIKEVQAGIKITRNYDSYQASLSAEILDGENPEEVGATLMEKASFIVNKQIDPRKSVVRKSGVIKNKTEIGAAWADKKFPGKLSIQIDGKWETVKISELKKIDDGYSYSKGGDSFTLKKIPEEKRTNGKMPLYRIYKNLEAEE